jgi:hypothetical protein
MGTSGSGSARMATARSDSVGRGQAMRSDVWQDMERAERPVRSGLLWRVQQWRATEWRDWVRNGVAVHGKQRLVKDRQGVVKWQTLGSAISFCVDS